jgi:hypothetical protein
MPNTESTAPTPRDLFVRQLYLHAQGLERHLREQGIDPHDHNDLDVEARLEAEHYDLGGWE